MKVPSYLRTSVPFITWKDFQRTAAAVLNKDSKYLSTGHLSTVDVTSGHKVVAQGLPIL